MPPIAAADVSISVRRGELVGLIGPNGARKSTLFNQIAGAYPPTSGTIVFEGQGVTAVPAAGRCALGIARTYQVPRHLAPTSACEARRRGSAIGDPTIANAVLDRLVHNAHRLTLKRESLRRAAARRHKLDAEFRQMT